MKAHRMRVVSVDPVVELVNEDESRSFTGYENHIIARGLSLLYSVIGEHPGRLTYSQACDVVRWCEGGAGRFTPDDDAQRRARLQCAVIDAINKDRVRLSWDEENHATAMVMVVEFLGLDLPCSQDQIIGKIKALIARNAELEAERDALRTALAKLVCEPGKPEYRDQARAALAIGAARAETGHG